jgi:NhaP-type Na+/H+ or K+/H+ antiporter
VEWALAGVAAILLAFAAVSGRLDGTSLTAPMFFAGAGLLVGSKAIGLIQLEPDGHTVKLLAETTLALVLFADASRIDLRILRNEPTVPVRLLGIGLPLTLLAGFAAALFILRPIAWPEALLVAVILAPTDAALGQEVITSPRLPSRIRQGLNVESGLNDGICVPLFYVVLAVAEASAGETGDVHAVRLVCEQLGFGALAGVIAGVAAATIVVFGSRRKLISETWLQVVPVAGAALAFGIAHGLHGSGFIAAFVGGAAFAAFGRMRHAHEEDSGYLIEELGSLSNAITFVVFGATFLGSALGDVTWRTGLYAALSLTAVRMLPVALAMLGTGARLPTIGILGWFGPRGLASIVFAVILIDGSSLPHEHTMLVTIFLTVGLSVVAHGITAAPFVGRYLNWFEKHPKVLGLEARASTDVRPRLLMGKRQDLDAGA